MSDVADRLSAAVAKERTVTAAWLFGSRASGASGAESDVDVGVLIATPASWEELLDLQGRLESAVADADVDLVDVRSAEPILAFEVVSGKLLFCRDRARIAIAVSLIAREYESAMELIKRGMRWRTE